MRREGTERAWFPLTRGRLVTLAVFTAVALGALYYVLPRLAGLEDTWERLSTGDPWWLAAAFAFEVVSFGGYVALFRRVFVRGGSRIGWRQSYQITMAGLAATRLFAAAGAGGIVLTVWALRRSGMAGREVGAGMTTFMVMLYGVYMIALLTVGVGLGTGLLEGGGSPAITFVPALFGGLVVALALALALLPRDPHWHTSARWTRSARRARWARRVAGVAATVAAGVRAALALTVRADPAVAWAVAWWAFDIAVLWACFHAFGAPPPVAVVVMAYFVGMAANTLPVPGGIGSVDGGMIGALIAFGVAPGLAIVAVLSYRAFAFWLPTIPGAIAYLGLRQTVKEWRLGDAPA
jgi:uncharacterized protein (TIRG00374 family)